MSLKKKDSIDVPVSDELTEVRMGNKRTLLLRKNPNYPHTMELFKKVYKQKVFEEYQSQHLPLPKIRVLDDIGKFEELMQTVWGGPYKAQNTCFDGGRTFCVHFRDKKTKERTVAALYGYKQFYRI